MSFEIQPLLICDTCGTRQIGLIERRVGAAKRCAQALRNKAERDGWVTVSRGRYHTEAHYCPSCIDKPRPPIKSGPRKKRPKRPPPIIIQDLSASSADPILDGEDWKPDPDTGDEWKS